MVDPIGCEVAVICDMGHGCVDRKKFGSRSLRVTAPPDIWLSQARPATRSDPTCEYAKRRTKSLGVRSDRLPGNHAGTAGRGQVNGEGVEDRPESQDIRCVFLVKKLLS